RAEDCHQDDQKKATLLHLTLHHLRGRWRRDYDPGVVFIEGQGERVALLRDHVLQRIAIALPNPGLEGIAVFVVGRRVPGLPAGHALLADVLEGGCPAEAGWPESGGARLGDP